MHSHHRAHLVSAWTFLWAATGSDFHHGGIYGAVAHCSSGSHCASLHILTAMFLWRALQAMRNGNTLGWPWLAPFLRLLGKLATTQPHGVATYLLLFSIHLTKPIKNLSPLNLAQPSLHVRLHQALLWITMCSAFLLCHLWATQLPQHKQAQGNPHVLPQQVSLPTPGQCCCHTLTSSEQSAKHIFSKY